MKQRRIQSKRTNRCGLTLLEILLSTAVLGIVLLAIAATMTSMQNIWMSLREKTDQYRTTRLAMDTIAARLSSATLASRWEHDPESSDTDDKYVRDSDLHFVSGPAEQLFQRGGYPGSAVFFQAPFGEHGEVTTTEPYHLMHQSLCSWGYFVEFESDAPERPAFLRSVSEIAPAKRRFRLMEFRQPADELPIFKPARNDETKPALASESSQLRLYDWFTRPLFLGSAKDRRVAVIAENVLAVLLTPSQSDAEEEVQILGNDDIYDTRRFIREPNDKGAVATRHRLPAVMQLTVIAMSEDAWAKMTDSEIGVKAGELRTILVGRFKDPQSIQRDLSHVETELTKQKMPHRILTMKIKMNAN